MPKISCVIPTYNRSHVLERSLQSILKQSHVPDEIIIVDDASTDQTQSVLQPYLSLKNIIFIVHQVNKGVSCARNTGIQKATGNWMAFLDSDDSWHSKKIEKQLQFIKKNPQCRLIHTEEIWIRYGEKINPKKKHKKKSGKIFEELLKLCLISPSAVMIHKEVFKKIGLFDIQLPCCEDFDFWLRASLHYSIDLLQEKLVTKYGGHRDQLSRTTKIQDIFRIQSMEKIFHDQALTNQQKKILCKELLRKISIVLQGAKRRKKTPMTHEYQKKHLFYSIHSKNL